jgi:hypothetical protein
MEKNQPYGLQALTPMYGQVIQSAPSWSGPYDVPPIADPIKLPKQESAASKWGGLIGNVVTTAGCAALAPTGIGLLACPLLGQAIGLGISKWIDS